MNFIQMTDLHGATVAINPLNITSIKILNATVCVILGPDQISTQFTDIAAAVDYVQRAPSISLATRTP